MSRRRITFAVLMALSVSSAVVAADLVLARVDGEPVTLEQLKLEFERRHQGHMQLLGDETVLRDFLEGAIRRRLFTQEARRMGLAETDWIERRVAEERAKVGIEWLYRTEVEERVSVTPQQLEAGLEKLKMSYQLIVIETDSLDAAREARERIEGGEPAEDVARAMSQAPSRTRGGLQGVAWGRTQTPAFEEALIAAGEGDLVGPIELDRGWIVARVDKVEQLELQNVEISRSVTENVLRMRETDRLLQDYLDDLRKRYDAKIVRERLDPQRLLLLAGQENPTARADDPIVAGWTGGQITLAEFAEGIRPDAFVELRPGQQRLQATQLLTNQVDQALLRLEVDARWEDAPSEVRDQVLTVENDLIFRELLGGVVFSEIEVSDEEIAEWYDAHRDDYVEPARILLAIAALETEDQAKAFLADVEGGALFADLASERSQDSATASKGGLAGWVTEDKAVAELRGEPFTLPTGALGGPVRIGEHWIVFRIMDRVDARPIPLAQVVDDVRKTVTERKSNARMDVWEEQLREVTAVKLNDAAVRKAGKQLLDAQNERFRDPPPAPGHGGGPPAGHPGGRPGGRP